MLISVRPEDFRASGDLLVDAGGTLEANLYAFASAISGTGGMAGSDPQAQPWADSYNEAARKAADAVGTFSSILKAMGTLLHQSGYNRAAAVAHSVLGGGAPLPPAVAYVDLTPPSPVALPTAFGGGTPEPYGWDLVAYVVGYVWPDGHQDLLLLAGNAWHELGAAIRAAAETSSSSLNSLVSTNVAPEIELIRVKSGRLQHDLSGIANFCDKLGEACDKFSAHLDAVHRQIVTELETLVATIAASQAAGIVMTVATGGGSELLASGADAGIIASTAARIAGIIGDLIDFVSGIVSTIGDLVGSAIGAFGDFVDGILEIAPELADFTDVADVSSVEVETVADTADSVTLGALDTSSADAVESESELAVDGASESAPVAEGAGAPAADASTTSERSLSSKVISGATSNVAGTYAGDQVQGKQFTLQDMGMAALFGGVSSYAGAVIAPEAEGLQALEKNVTIDAVSGGSQEAATELVDNHGNLQDLNPEEIISSAFTSGVGGIADTVTGHFTEPGADHVSSAEMSHDIHVDESLRVDAGATSNDVTASQLVDVIDPKAPLTPTTDPSGVVQPTRGGQPVEHVDMPRE